MGGSPKAGGLPSAVVVSDYTSEEAKARWEIRGFSLVGKGKGEKVESGPLVKVAGAEFGLRLFLGGSDKASKGKYSLYCLREDETGEPVKATFSISIICQAKVPLAGPSATEKVGHVFGTAGFNRDRGWADFGDLSHLQNPLALLIVEDTLVIELSVKALVSVKIRRCPVVCGAGAGSCNAYDGVQRRLADDFLELLDSGQASDIAVRGSLGDGERVVRAHRIVMAARSPVFHRMLLTSSMRESRSDATIDLEGVDHVIAARFIRFLYSNELDQETVQSSDDLCHLLALAHRYEVQSLMECCTARLAMSLTVETAVEQLVLAEQLGIPSLKARSKEYICSCRTRLGQIQTTAAFSRMSKNYPHLLVELFAEVFPPAAKKSRTEECGSSQ